jgi:proline dehydrogenase
MRASITTASAAPGDTVEAVSAPAQDDVQRVGGQLATALPRAWQAPRQSVDNAVMNYVARDPQLQAALFRFVDVAPAARSDTERAELLIALLEEVEPPPRSVRAAMRLSHTPRGERVLGASATTAVRQMAHRFIVGETLAEASAPLAELWRQGVANSVDLLGEATVTAAEADDYAARCLQALEQLASITARLPPRPILEADSQGALPRANLSVKLSALTPLMRPEAPGAGTADVITRLRPILEAAKKLGAHLHIDTESLDSREAVFDAALGLLAEPEFRDGPSAGVVLQAYLTDSGEVLDQILEFAHANPRATPLTVRLVKGAYWDHELVHARQQGWQPPVFDDKRATDRNFEALTLRLVQARPAVRVAIASHNLRSVSFAIAASRALDAPDQDLELQVLRGLGDPLQAALAKNGLRVRTYCPVGGLVAGMAYLVRRLLENSSQQSFLQAQASGVPLKQLLAAP